MTITCRPVPPIGPWIGERFKWFLWLALPVPLLHTIPFPWLTRWLGLPLRRTCTYMRCVWHNLIATNVRHLVSPSSHVQSHS
ncbi:hypothetical protein V8E55_002868 [Tylopilus felleus]